jgi:response regulator RpfG family c-di-GMP phosphodiesterase
MDNNLTLLLVDDEPNVLKSLRRLLIDTEYKVYSSDSAENAWAYLEKEKIQLVISDYRMPGMNGVEFLNKVREKYPETIRIILSGYADVMAIVDAINDGQVYRFVTKPWNDQELLTSIMRAFEQYTLKEENAKLYAELHGRNADLQDLAKTLEEKVMARTRDLELKNRALHITQNIMSLLPVGILGMDSMENVVYMNTNLKKFINTDNIKLGLPMEDAISGDIISALHHSIEKMTTIYTVLDKEKSLSVICTPLPNAEGAIGLFTHLDINKYGPFYNIATQKGVDDARNL